MPSHTKKSCPKGQRVSKDKRKKGACVKKRKAPQSAAMKSRSAEVKGAFAAVKKAKKDGQKINAAAVMKNPADAKKNPSKYCK